MTQTAAVASKTLLPLPGSGGPQDWGPAKQQQKHDGSRLPRHCDGTQSFRLSGPEHMRLTNQDARHAAYHEQELEAIYDRIDAEHRLPVLPEDVQAHIPLQIYVGMVHLKCRWSEWEGGLRPDEYESSGPPLSGT